MLLDVEYTIIVKTQVAYNSMADKLSDMTGQQKGVLDRYLSDIGEDIADAAVKEVRVKSDEGFYSSESVYPVQYQARMAQ